MSQQIIRSSFLERHVVEIASDQTSICSLHSHCDHRKANSETGLSSSGKLSLEVGYIMLSSPEIRQSHLRT